MPRPRQGAQLELGHQAHSSSHSLQAASGGDASLSENARDHTEGPQGKFANSLNFGNRCLGARAMPLRKLSRPSKLERVGSANRRPNAWVICRRLDERPRCMADATTQKAGVSPQASRFIARPRLGQCSGMTLEAGRCNESVARMNVGVTLAYQEALR